MNDFDIGWPWMGLGAAVVLLVLMLGTDTMRSRASGSRWWDPTWLAWLGVPLYLVHQFEEYPLHFIAARGSYEIVEGVCKAQGYDLHPNCPIPLSHFPVVNIALVWAAAPVAAWLCRRNPVVGLTYYGFILANGLLHVVTGAIADGGPLSSPGFVTGALLFVPSAIWVSYVSVKSGLMTKSALALSLGGGIAGHVALVGAYWFVRVGGTPGILAADVVTAFVPILIAGVGSKLMGLAPTSATRAP